MRKATHVVFDGSKSTKSLDGLNVDLKDEEE